MQNKSFNEEAKGKALQRAMGVVEAYIAANPVQPADLPDLMVAVHKAFAQLADPAVEPAEPAFARPSPSAIRRSITPDALISFIDGKPYKTLKRHLAKNGLDLESYKARYGLPSDYPSTSATYSATRSELARSLGLGRRVHRGPEADAGQSDPAPSTDTAPKRRGRPPKAA